MERASDCRVQQPGLALLHPILVVHHQHQKQKQQLAHAMLIKDIKMRCEETPARNVISFSTYLHERSQSLDFVGLLFRPQKAVAIWRSNPPAVYSRGSHHSGLQGQVVLHLRVHRSPYGCADQGLQTNLRDIESSI